MSFRFATALGMGISVLILFSVAALAEDSYVPKLPLGLPAAEFNAGASAPITEEKIQLGKRLFWDKRWSVAKTISCRTCHTPELGWSGEQRFMTNSLGKTQRRHSPTIVNRAFTILQHSSGERKSIEDQALRAPDAGPTAVEYLNRIPEYRELFQRVFNSEGTSENITQAIGAYVRTIVSGNSPYDRYMAGDKTAMDKSAVRGMKLFNGKAKCVNCHSGYNFSDEGFHNLGVGINAEKPDLGRFEMSKREVSRGAFKTPTVRDAALRPFLMHDGSITNLEILMNFYNRGGNPNPQLAPELKPLKFGTRELQDIIAFIKALTGEKLADSVGTAPVLPADPPEPTPTPAVIVTPTVTPPPAVIPAVIPAVTPAKE